MFNRAKEKIERRHAESTESGLIWREGSIGFPCTAESFGWYVLHMYLYVHVNVNTCWYLYCTVNYAMGGVEQLNEIKVFSPKVGLHSACVDVDLSLKRTHPPLDREMT